MVRHSDGGDDRRLHRPADGAARLLSGGRRGHQRDARRDGAADRAVQGPDGAGTDAFAGGLIWPALTAASCRRQLAYSRNRMSHAAACGSALGGVIASWSDTRNTKSGPAGRHAGGTMDWESTTHLVIASRRLAAWRSRAARQAFLARPWIATLRSR